MPDSRSLVCGNVDGAWIWAARAGTARQPVLAHETDAPAAVFSLDGSRLATAAPGGSVQL